MSAVPRLVLPVIVLALRFVVGFLLAGSYPVGAWPLAQVLPWLAAGPLVGLWMMRSLLTSRTATPDSRTP